MSFDPKNSASCDFGEHYLHTINKRRDFYPPDFEKGYEYFKEYHICFWCGEQSHEANLTRDEGGSWIHPECYDYRTEVYKQFNNKKP